MRSFRSLPLILIAFHLALLTEGFRSSLGHLQVKVDNKQLHHTQLQMSTSTGSLRHKLLSGGRSYGPVCMSDSPVVIELLASLGGYGHLVIDHEHSPTDLASSQKLLTAIDAAAAFSKEGRTAPIVRTPYHDTAYMKQVLDSLRLPAGVLVPMVETPEMARAVVKSTRYPPRGVRGNALPFVRASGWGTSLDNYNVDDDLLVMVQVETAEGVDHIPEIAAVDGVDGIFLGPFDLSTSIGKMGQFDNPEVQELIHTAEQKVLDSPDCLLAGFRSGTRSIAEMYQRGYSLVCGSIDLGLLKKAALQDIQEANDADT